jgi:hypothetical protein
MRRGRWRAGGEDDRTTQKRSTQPTGNGDSSLCKAVAVAEPSHEPMLLPSGAVK